MSNSEGYKEPFDKTFNLVRNKQKLYEYEFNYFNIDEKKIQKAVIYRPYDNLRASGFTFENKVEKETCNVKFSEKLDFIEQSYSSAASKYDFKTLYRYFNMMFIWRDGQFYGSNVDGLAEIYNDSLKGKKLLSPDEKYNILWKHYNSLKDISKKTIC